MSASSALIATVDGVVMTAWGVERFSCPVCEAPRDLVVPDCGDDQGDQGYRIDPGDGGDRACAVCGFAISLGGMPRPQTGAAPDVRGQAS